MPYFEELVGRVKIQTTSKFFQRYYTTKRLIRDLLSNAPNCYVRVGKFRGYFFIYFQGMRDSGMRSGTELAREIFRLLCCVAVSILFEISLSSNCFSSFDLSNKLGSIFASHYNSSSSEN